MTFQGPSLDPAGASIAGDATQIEFAFSPDMVTDKPVIGKPTWTHLPEALDVAASFPAAASAAHVSVGHVVLACDVGPGFIWPIAPSKVSRRMGWASGRPRWR